MNTRTPGPIRRGIAALPICLIALTAQIGMSRAAAAQSAQAVTSRQMPVLMDWQKEIALALSACPPSVADQLSWLAKARLMPSSSFL